MNGEEMYVEKVKVVELTFEDGTKKLCRGGEEAVLRAWGTYPVVSARWTGEEETMQWAIPQHVIDEEKVDEEILNRHDRRQMEMFDDPDWNYSGLR